MTDMVERVARAIFMVPSAPLSEHVLDAAKRAIGAIREPTPEMIDVGNDVISNTCDIWWPSEGVDVSAPPCALDVWRVMSDEALAHRSAAVTSLVARK
jgi:hypothetical protein